MRSKRARTSSPVASCERGVVDKLIGGETALPKGFGAGTVKPCLFRLSNTRTRIFLATHVISYTNLHGRCILETLEKLCWRLSQGRVCVY